MPALGLGGLNRRPRMQPRCEGEEGLFPAACANRPQLFATSASHGGCWRSTALQHALKAVKFANSSFPQIRWTTLEHSGVLFPPEYQPHGVKMLYGESDWGV